MFERVVGVVSLGQNVSSCLNSQGNSVLERDVLAEEDEVDLVVAAGVAGPVRSVEVGGVVVGQVRLARRSRRISRRRRRRAGRSGVLGVFAQGLVEDLVLVEEVASLRCGHSPGSRMPWTIVSGQTISSAPAAAAALLLTISSSKSCPLALKLCLTD